MGDDSSISLLPLGLIEIDTAGTVIYYKPEGQGVSDITPPEIVGRNFFTDIAPVAQARDFQDLVKNFQHSHVPAVSHNFTFVEGHVTLPVRILLARIHEKLGLDTTESFFVHIRPGQHQLAA